MPSLSATSWARICPSNAGAAPLWSSCAVNSKGPPLSVPCTFWMVARARPGGPPLHSGKLQPRLGGLVDHGDPGIPDQDLQPGEFGRARVRVDRRRGLRVRGGLEQVAQFERPVLAPEDPQGHPFDLDLGRFHLAGQELETIHVGPGVVHLEPGVGARPRRRDLQVFKVNPAADANVQGVEVALGVRWPRSVGRRSSPGPSRSGRSSGRRPRPKGGATASQAE